MSCMTSRRMETLRMVRDGAVTRFVADSSWWLDGGQRQTDRGLTGALNWLDQFELIRVEKGGKVLLTERGEAALGG